MTSNSISAVALKSCARKKREKNVNTSVFMCLLNYNGKYSPEDAIDKLFDRGNMLLLKGYKKFYRTLYYSLEKLKRIDDGTPKRELSVPESIDELIKASLKKTLL